MQQATISQSSSQLPAAQVVAGGSVAVLFARSNSYYKVLPGCEVFDLARDARTFDGSIPVVAHPPCRAWGRLRHMAKPRADEKALGLFAVETVRRCGGVLEHPAHSTLWPAAGLPAPGTRDSFGGWTLPLYQGHFGHRAPKATWFYVLGLEPADLPPIPFDLALPVGRVENMGKAEREATPPELARFLVEIARRVGGAKPRLAACILST